MRKRVVILGLLMCLALIGFTSCEPPIVRALDGDWDMAAFAGGEAVGVYSGYGAYLGDSGTFSFQ